MKNTYKSLFGLMVAFVFQLPLVDNPLGLTLPNGGGRVLWLDYEADHTQVKRQWTAIHRGFKPLIEKDLKAHNFKDEDINDVEMPLMYKRMKLPLVELVETLKPEMKANKIKLVIVDSLGPAAGGDLYAPQPALAFNQALRALDVTSLTIAHPAKGMGDQKQKSIFGSVYFSTLARSIWIAERNEVEDIPDEGTVTLSHVNTNLSELHAPLGYRYFFDNVNNTISVTRLTPDQIQETSLRKNLSYSQQVEYEWRYGPKTFKELSEGTGIEEKVVRATVYRMEKNTHAKKYQPKDGLDQWGKPEGYSQAS
jgi:hypothetical protein